MDKDIKICCQILDDQVQTGKVSNLHRGTHQILQVKLHCRSSGTVSPCFDSQVWKIRWCVTSQHQHQPRTATFSSQCLPLYRGVVLVNEVLSQEEHLLFCLGVFWLADVLARSHYWAHADLLSACSGLMGQKETRVSWVTKAPLVIWTGLGEVSG